MTEKILPGMQKLKEAEMKARENARPEPIYKHENELKPRVILPPKGEIAVLKKTQGIKYLGQ